MWLFLKLLKNLREIPALRESRKSEPYRLSMSMRRVASLPVCAAEHVGT
jgi:hypothetical protein